MIYDVTNMAYRIKIFKNLYYKVKLSSFEGECFKGI